MDKAHKVGKVSVSGALMSLVVDGRKYKVDLSKQTKRLADATPEQRRNFIISPASYGIHWPDLDEDLSIDGLIGVTHAGPPAKSIQ